MRNDMTKRTVPVGAIVPVVAGLLGMGATLARSASVARPLL
jgi:hypothetical protein